MKEMLGIADIYEGMIIEDKSQLSNIYDTWIILVKVPGEEHYTIGYIGTETNERSDELFHNGNKVCPVYNDSIELEGDIYFEE